MTGYDEPDVRELSEENRRAPRAQGVEVLTCAHAVAGSGVPNRIGICQVDAITAYTFRIFGQETKVAVGVALPRIPFFSGPVGM
ncbi:MAG: hypothetical protein JXL20_07970 [Deltaproteobacteria bacterium]|nr:hypothetical protein [Deltaproteobacteria bacterium]